MVRGKQKGIVVDKIRKGYKKYTNLSDSKIDEIVSGAADSWLYSKLQATQLVDIMEGITSQEKKNQVIEDLYLYASSQSKYSAAYYKLE